MKNFTTEERRLTLDGYRIKFYYNQTFQFVLSPREDLLVIIKKVGLKNWKEVENTVKTVNKTLGDHKKLIIHEESLLVPPSDKVWKGIWASTFFILIGFVLEILSAYYLGSSQLAYAGLGIFILGFAILAYLLIQQQFFSSFQIEDYMSQKEYYNHLVEAVNQFMNSNSLIFENDSFRCEYKKPFLLEFCVY